MAFTISYKFIANDAFTKVSDKMAISINKVRANVDKVRTSSLKLNPSFKSIQSVGKASFDTIIASIILLETKTNKAKAKLGQITSEVQKLASKKFDALVSSANKLTQAFKKAKEAGQGLRDAGQSMSTYVTLPIIAGGTAALIASAKVETMTVSFESMLGSAEAAQSMMEKLINFTATTPFQLEGVSQSAKMLLSFGVATEDIEDRLRMIGDVASGINAPIGDIALIFGQVKAKGKLMNEEILQLSERGVPILDVLAKGLGKTKAEVTDLASKSAISFDVFLKAFQKTRELKFMNQMEKQSQTLAGKWSTLVDNVVLGSAKIGDIIVKEFNVKGILDKMINGVASLTTKIVEFTSKHPMITKLIVAFVSFVAALGPVLIALGSLVMIAKVAAVGLGVLGTVFGIITSPITLVIAAIAAAAAGIYLLYDNWETVTAKSSELWSSFKSYVSNLWESLLDYFLEAGDKLLNYMLAPFKAAIGKISEYTSIIGNKIDSVGNFFSDAFTFGDSNVNVSKNTELSGETLINNKSRSDINLNINAPKGTVQSVEKKSTGFDNVNLGFNMIGAY